jgi:response regulator RpfG family c-di-GMP phosphodiesterase/signal transduction histidine kinase
MNMVNNNHITNEADLFKQKFAIFQEISTAIVAMDDIKSIAKLLVDIAINYANAEKGSLMLVNEKEELYILAARDIDNHFIRTYRAKVGEGIAGTVAQNATPVLVEDIEKDKRFTGRKKDRYRTRSFISCPIMSRKKMLGVLNINDKKDGTSFTEDEFELMKVIANQAAMALENAFLLNQLKLRAIELEEINRKLMDSDHAKTDFLTRVSHELRTPLNSIKGAIYYLKQSEPLERDARKEFYRIISDETNSVISVIENLIDFIRLEDEMKVLSKTALNIAALLREISESRALRDALAKKNLTLELDVKDDVAEIVGDRMKISQFFINLIRGLMHHLKKGDTIRISTHENEFLEVHVDLGRKMPEAVLTYLLTAKKAFDPDQSDEMVQLYLARKAAEVHHWNLAMRNTENACSIRISILKDVDQKIETAIKMTLDMFVEFISDILNIDRCSIMLTDNLTGDLTIKSSLGLSDDIVNRTRIRPGDKIAGWVALEGKPLMIEDINNDPKFGKHGLTNYTSHSFISLPLKLKDRVVGVVNLNNKKNSEEFTGKDFHIASLISDRISYFIDKFTTRKYGESDFHRFVKSFDSLIDAEKKYHKKQSFLTDLIMSMLEELGASDEVKRIAPYISMVYDFGLMLIDDEILKKKSLSPSETRSLRFHPHNTVFLLESLEFSDVIKDAILHHHERYDGTGYPDGLKGDDIPLLSRVIAVADSFFAMTMDRPYRKKISKDKALEEIRQGAGTLYDPAVAAALETVIRKG